MRREQLHGSHLTVVPRIMSPAVLNLFLLLLLHTVAGAQETPEGGPVATTDRFVFHSRFPLNLHDGLLRSAVGVETSTSACLQALPEQDRDAWDRAVQQYRELFTAQGDRRRVVLVRLHLAGLAERVRRPLEPMPEEVHQALEAGTAAYRACWWRKDDEANRRWISALVAILLEVEEELVPRLAEAYQTAWPSWRTPVDVVPYVSRQGAHTILRPDHILITSSDEGYQGRAALEMIFHEASHTIIGPRAGESSHQFREAAERLGVEVPRVLWHVVLFYTAGEVVRKVIAERYGEEYLPYLYATGLFQRAWPEFQEPLERRWKPYLEGELQMAQAAEGVLRALSK